MTNGKSMETGLKMQLNKAVVERFTRDGLMKVTR